MGYLKRGSGNLPKYYFLFREARIVGGDQVMGLESKMYWGSGMGYL